MVPAPRITSGCGYRRDVDRAAARAVVARELLGLVIVAARDERGAGTRDRVELHLRRLGRHVHRQGEAHQARRLRDAAPVVAGRRRHERPRFGGRFREPQHRVEGAANLERRGRLLGLELERHVSAGGPRQPRRRAELRPSDVRRDARGGGVDVGPCDQRAGLSAEMRISARLAANAERGRTWSAPALRAAAMRSV